MSVTLQSGEKIAALKHGIESVTGETYTDLTEAVNGLKEKQYEAGKKAEWDKFWDVLQNNGNGANYYYLFSYNRFTDENFQPKHDIVGGTANNCLQNSFYNNSKITEIPVSIVANSAHLGGLFYQANNIKKIHKIVINVALTSVSSMFTQCAALEELTIEGTIGVSGLNLQWSPNLTHDSLMSIINALADKSADTSGTIWTATIGEVNRAKLSAEDLEIANQKGWNIE